MNRLLELAWLHNIEINVESNKYDSDVVVVKFIDNKYQWVTHKRCRVVEINIRDVLEQSVECNAYLVMELAEFIEELRAEN